MDNSLETKEKTPKAEGLTPPTKVKTKTFLICKRLKTKGLLQTAAKRASGSATKPQLKTPDSLRRGASQAAGAAPTLRYGPAGDSAPRLRLRRPGMPERFPFGPSTRPECSAFWTSCDAI